MKEKLYTIPLNDAVAADDECPICNARRSLENDAIDYAIGPGASYMESDIREMTDKTGFCERHYKKMYEYGNSLGNALILSTHIRKAAADLKKEMVEEAQTQYIDAVLRQNGNNQTKAAKQLQIGRTTLWRRAGAKS